MAVSSLRQQGVPYDPLDQTDQGIYSLSSKIFLNIYYHFFFLKGC